MLLGSASIALWYEGSGLDVIPTIISFGVPALSRQFVSPRSCFCVPILIISKPMRFSSGDSRPKVPAVIGLSSPKELVRVQLSASPQNSGGLVLTPY